jgi:hypothetical protein
VLGSSATLSNSQCSVSMAGSSQSFLGNSYTSNLAVGFTAAYAGAKNIYAYASGPGRGLFGLADGGDVGGGDATNHYHGDGGADADCGWGGLCIALHGLLDSGDEPHDLRALRIGPDGNAISVR